MTHTYDSLQSLDIATYHKVQARMLRRAKTLPPDKLETLAREAIRRLASRNDASSKNETRPSVVVITRLCNALIGDDVTAAASFVRRLQDGGVSAETIYLHYLAPAARQLGTWWEEDRAPFWKVTVGTGRLLAIMRAMSSEFHSRTVIEHKAATFAAVPGEQHVLGLHMAVDMFRKDGWDITHLVGYEHDQLVDEIENSGNALIGLSLSGEKALDALARLVVAIRVCGPKARIFVSGPRIADLRSKLTVLDLDGIAEDVEDGKQQMSRVVQSA